MDKKNIIITCLALIILILAIIMWQDSARNREARLQSDSDQAEQMDPENDSPGAQQPIENKPNGSNNSDSNSGAAQSFEQQLPQKNWTLWSVTLDGAKVNLNVNVPKPLTLEFDTTKKTYGGFGGCNGFGGDYTSSGGTNFSFGASMGTLMYCEATSDLENKYSAAREKVSTFMIKGDQLVFTSQDGKTELVFSPSI